VDNHDNKAVSGDTETAFFIIYPAYPGLVFKVTILIALGLILAAGE